MQKNTIYAIYFDGLNQKIKIEDGPFKIRLADIWFLLATQRFY